MTQYPLKDYVSLITKLLQCPEGEEWQLFRRYDHLINEDLVQVLEQIAQNFLHQGDSRSASFLHRWAQEIRGHLSNQASPIEQDRYDDLIQMLLDCPKGHEDTILHQYRSLLTDGFTERLKNIAQEFEMEGNLAKAGYLRSLLESLNRHRPIDAPVTASTHTDDTATDDTATDDTASEETASLYTSIVHPLEKLTLSIQQLVDAIALQSRPQPQLSYLDLLEKAYIHQWLLTTHEIEMLMGAKPHCAPPEKDYRRGGWRFVKCGKVGRDRLWQVFKIRPSDITATETATGVQTDSDGQHLLPEEMPDPWLPELSNP